MMNRIMSQEEREKLANTARANHLTEEDRQSLTLLVMIDIAQSLDEIASYFHWKNEL